MILISFRFIYFYFKNFPNTNCWYIIISLFMILKYKFCSSSLVYLIFENLSQIKNVITQDLSTERPLLQLHHIRLQEYFFKIFRKIIGLVTQIPLKLLQRFCPLSFIGITYTFFNFCGIGTRAKILLYNSVYIVTMLVPLSVNNLIFTLPGTG